jgi:hypothetical protein
VLYLVVRSTMMRFFPHAEPTRRKTTAQLLEDAAGWHRKAVGSFSDAEAAGRARESDSADAARRADATQSTLVQQVSNVADLRKVLRHGPLSDVHLISWWQGSRRFLEAIGGSAGREDVACLVIMNIAGPDAAAHP